MASKHKNTILTFKGFTLLEVMLSMVILTIIVYSVFTAFDKTMQVLDSTFTESYKYEQIRRFFDQITKEVVSSTIVESDEYHYFKGGPHWIEFSTPLIEDLSVDDYIKTGVTGLFPTRRKVHYFSARISDYSEEYKANTNKNLHLLFENHLFRLQPLGTFDDIGKLTTNFTRYLIDEDSAGYSSSYETFPYWLENLYLNNIVNSKNGDAILNPDSADKVISITEMLSCRAIQFRYHYQVREKTTGVIHDYYQDWWDSRIKYPSYNSNLSGEDLLNTVYTSSNYSLYQDEVEEERKRRYGTSSLANTGEFTYNESWLYASETSNFIKFDQGNTYADPENICQTGLVRSDPDSKYDPWFQKPPQKLEIIVYIFDKNKNKLPTKSLTSEIKSLGNFTTKSITEVQLQDAYKGDVFSIIISIPTSSEYISNYYRDLVVE